MKLPRIIWFRNDLRLRDNAALSEAARDGHPVIPFFSIDPKYPPVLGEAQEWWLSRSLEALAKELAPCRLIIRSGDTVTSLRKLIDETGAEGVYANRLYTPDGYESEDAVEKELPLQTFANGLLVEPWEVEKQGGGPFHVFTPFYRKARATYHHRKPLPKPTLTPYTARLASEPLPSCDAKWSKKLGAYWTPGEEAARAKLSHFSKTALSGYDSQRDFPGVDGTSQLSPHLHFGELSPMQVLDSIDADKYQTFESELFWREFGHHLLYIHPKLSTEPLDTRFKALSWVRSEKRLEAWKRGKTGYPIVDAGMRQLWETGWMHNRVRMVVGSFLVKHLGIHWHEGERWFRHTLLDADEASNGMNWQWVTGCGADAMPYFRIFNPMTQGKKFDPDGDYVREFVPELAQLEKRYIHEPWEAPEEVLRLAGITLGETYPQPIVDHKTAREEALARLKK
jgi:deoxyribodipyrimidine photo-lyase